MERLTWKDESGYYAPKNVTLNALKKRGELVDRLASYEDLEEQGRLVVLPCKVGDTVYVLNASKFHRGEVYEGYVSSFHYSFHGLEMLGTGFYGRVDDLLNKKVFLTRVESEAALKGVSEDG